MRKLLHRDEKIDPVSHYDEKLSLNDELVSQYNEKLFTIMSYLPQNGEKHFSLRY